MAEYDRSEDNLLALLEREQADEQMRVSTAAELSDEDLLRAFALLGNKSVLIDALWLPIIETELYRRSLIN